MLRKLVVLGLSVLMLSSLAMAGDLVLLDPIGKPALRGPVASDLDELDDIFYLRRHTGSAEYYLGSGSLNDTFAVVFQPLAPCSVYFAEMDWHDSGNLQAFIWEFSDDCASVYPDGRSTLRGEAEYGPCGDVLFGPFNTTATGNDEERLFSPGDLPDGGIWLADGRQFVVGFVKTQDDGLPHPLADDVSARGFQYTWFGGPWMASFPNPWGGYSSSLPLEIMMRVGVSYPLGAPPIIGDMNQLSSTINTSKVCTINCEIIDDNGWTTDTATLKVKVNDGDVIDYPMTDENSDNIFTATFTLNSGGVDVAVGDVVKYWIYAVDDEGGENTNEDDQLSFEIIELVHPDADILLVDYGLDDRETVVTTWMTENQIYANHYYVDANKGIDEYTVGAGFGTVLVFGWGAAMPIRDYGDDPYSAWLEEGGNIFYSDMDYFYGAGEPEEPTYAANDFAYDFFGIAGGTNDPTVTDSVFFGVAGNELTNDFENDAYETYPELYSGNYGDFVTANPSAVAIFSGFDLGNDMGLALDRGNGKSVYLAFDAPSSCINQGDTLLLPTAQFTTLMNNVIAWFGSNDAPEFNGSIPSQYNLSQNYPNPFNPTTNITFAVPTSGLVTVKVFNLTGQEVATLFRGQANAGTQTITFDATNLASGIYLYRMDAGTFTNTRKMILIK